MSCSVSIVRWFIVFGGFSSTLGSEWTCKGSYETQCTILHFDSVGSSISELRTTLPKGIMSMQFKHWEALSFGSSIFKSLPASLEGLEITESRPLLHFLLPSTSTIKRLAIAKSQLIWIHFQTNVAIETLSIISSNLQLVPPSLQNLKNVKHIKLQKSYIRYLNLDILQTLTKLKTLDLMYNKIHTIASTLHKLPHHSFVTLNLSNNQLKVLNLEVLPLIGLFQVVDLSHNKIELLVGRFTSVHLTNLIIAHNRLKVIDFCQWKAVPSLVKISFVGNELARVPSCIHHLTNLTYIDFGENKFTQVNMDVFGEMRNLATLDFSANKISLITFREEKYPTGLSRLILKDNRGNCDVTSDGVFCPLDIEFKSIVPFHDDWTMHNSSFQRQLMIVK